MSTGFMAKLSAVVAIIVSVFVVATGSASAATYSATPATFASVLSQAQAGDTILLGTGNYGTWQGTNKVVTIKAAAGASPTMKVNFNTGDQGFTLDGLGNMGGVIYNGANSITIRNSAFTSPIVIDGPHNGNILLDHNTHNNINFDGGSPARIHLAYGDGSNSGVTVQNSVLSGGSTDGIQAGVGVNILNNEFTGIREGSCAACHTDPIQLIEAPGSVVRGNWLHNNQDGITAFDGLLNATITDNAVGPQQSDSDCIDMYSLQNSVVAHNSCTSGMGIYVDHKSVDPASTGNVFRDNMAPAGVNGPDTSRNTLTNNLTNPTYQGGVAPTSYAGFRLAIGSPGIGTATDLGDVGVRFTGTPTPTPTPTASPSPTPTPTASASPTASPTATPTPYAPACAPTCDEQIQALKDKIAAAKAALE